MPMPVIETGDGDGDVDSLHAKWEERKSDREANYDAKFKSGLRMRGMGMRTKKHKQEELN